MLSPIICQRHFHPFVAVSFLLLRLKCTFLIYIYFPVKIQYNESYILLLSFIKMEIKEVRVYAMSLL